MAEVQSPIEAVRSPTYTPLLGLQGRLAMGGDALNPSTTPVLKEGFKNGESTEKTVKLMEKASRNERVSYWNSQTEKTSDAQLTAWKESVVGKITHIPQSAIGRDHSDFFTKVGIDAAHFTLNNAQTLYDKYFSPDHEGEAIDLFISDMVKSFTTLDSTTQKSTTDIAALKKHLPAIQWMAGMFGANSSELVTQLLDAEIDNSVDEVVFVSARKDEVNKLSQHEKDLLTFLTKGEIAKPTPKPNTSKPKTGTPEADPDEKKHGDEEEETIVIDLPLSNLDELKQNNLKASHQFINILRSDLKPSNHADFLINKFNMPIHKDSDEFEVNNFAIQMGDRYNLPLGIMVRGSHAFLITNTPHERAGKWYLSVWNPYGKGGTGKAETEEVELHGNYSSQNDLTANLLQEKDSNVDHPQFVFNKQWLDGYKKDPKSTDLEALLDQKEFEGMREELRDLKFSALQQDDKNCVPLCGYLGAILNRLSDSSPFITSGGVAQFEKDFDIHLRTKGEIAPLTPDPEIEKNRVTQAYGEKVRGNQHLRTGKPCQDAIMVENDAKNGIYFLAVADGHGGEKHMRSDTGAQLAVEVLGQQFAIIPELIDHQGIAKAKMYIQTRLAKKIHDEWKRKVQTDINAQPFTNEEQALIKPGEELVAYGATLLGALKIGNELLVVRLGDGDIRITDEEGVDSPVPHESALFANETTSLCQDDAPAHTFVKIINTDAYTNPMITISTDGVLNSYNNEPDFHKLMAGLYPMSDEVIKKDLKKWLEEITKNGSGDDITLGIMRIKNK